MEGAGGTVPLGGTFPFEYKVHQVILPYLYAFIIGTTSSTATPRR